MLQYSKVLRSREEWKAKAKQRGNELREQRKNQTRYRQRITELKARVKQLEAAAAEEKKRSPWLRNRIRVNGVVG